MRNRIFLSVFDFSHAQESMSKSHAILKFLRKIHLYLGVFIAPALLFFAFTGALQTFSLHETTQGSSYKPPAWIATLAQLHKKQTTVVPVRKQRPALPDIPKTTASRIDPSSSSAGPTSVIPQTAKIPDASSPKSHLPMKIFFLLVSLGLSLSTLTGIYMAYKYSRSKLLISALLLAGAIMPLILLPF
jgi:hypothetical protein